MNTPKTLIFLHLATLLLLLGACTQNTQQATDSDNTNLKTAETLQCQLVPLSEYGFKQLSDYDEYICESVSDFIVIADTDKNMQLGDKLKVSLNKHGEVLQHEHVN